MFSIKKESKKIKITLLSLMVLFLFVCIFTSFYYNDSLLLGSLEEFNNDDVKYLRSAQTLIKTGKFTYNYPDIPTVFIMPGITFLLTPFVWLFSLHGAVMPVRIFFALLQTFNLYVLFLLTRKVFNSVTGIITSIIYILYLPNIYVSTLILTEVPFFTLFLLMIYISIEATQTNNAKLFVIAGICWGLSALFRPTIVAYPLMLLVYWLFKKVKFKKMLIYGLCGIIPLILILSPWIIRNYVTFNKFIPLTLSSGNPRLQGTVIGYSQENREELYKNVNVSDVNYGDNEITRDAAEHEISERFFDYNLKNHTTEYIKWYTIGKTVKNFEYPFVWHPLFYEEYAPVFAFHLNILALSLVSFILMIITKKMNSEAGFLIFSVFIFNCLHLPFYCFPRYMYPIMSFIIMISSYGIYTASEKTLKVLRKIKHKGEQLEKTDNNSCIQ